MSHNAIPRANQYHIVTSLFIRHRIRVHKKRQRPSLYTIVNKLLSQNSAILSNYSQHLNIHEHQQITTTNVTSDIHKKDNSHTWENMITIALLLRPRAKAFDSVGPTDLRFGWSLILLMPITPKHLSYIYAGNTMEARIWTIVSSTWKDHCILQH